MIHVGDCLTTMQGMEGGSVQTCITSPPYFGLRDYGVADQIGLEDTPAEYVARLVAVFREVRRLLREDGTLWLNLGDSYSGSRSGPDTGSTLQGSRHNQNAAKDAKRAHATVESGVKYKDLMGIPWRVAFALQDDGWFLRQDIIWSKPNPMPESVGDRCTKAHEYLFLLSKSPRYYFDQGAIREPAALGAQGSRSRNRRDSFERSGIVGEHVLPGQRAAQHRDAREPSAYDLDTRNKRSVWTVPTVPFKEAHFATFPERLIEPCVLAGAPAGGLVLDPFMGAGTTAVVAQRLGRRWVGCELNPEYAAMAEARVGRAQPGLVLGDVA